MGADIYVDDNLAAKGIISVFSDAMTDLQCADSSALELAVSWHGRLAIRRLAYFQIGQRVTAAVTA